MISRNFYADEPHEKLLTDIRAFALLDGKLYLSAIVDCFDGMVVSRIIGFRPNADLVNAMLDETIADLPDGYLPTVHSDGGLPAWIERMKGLVALVPCLRRDVALITRHVRASLADSKNGLFFERSWVGTLLDNFVWKFDDYINWYNRK